MQRSLNSCNKAVSLILVDAFREFENLGVLEKKCGYAKIKTEFKKFVLKHPELKSDSRIRDILTHRSYNTQSVTRFISDLPEGEKLKEEYVKEQPECFQKKASPSGDSEQTSIQSQRIDQLSDRLTKMKQRHEESEKLHNEKYAALREDHDDLQKDHDDLHATVELLRLEVQDTRSLVEAMREHIRDESTK
jgi:hypothetical protein